MGTPYGDGTMKQRWMNLCFVGVLSFARAIFADAVPWQQQSLEVNTQDLELQYVSQAQWVWDDVGSGAFFNTAIYRPVAPQGFHVLGYVAYGPYSKDAPEVQLRTFIVARAVNPSALKPPLDYQWIGDDHNSGARTDVSWWRAIPQPGYRCLSTVFVPYHGKPAPESIMCVREDLTTAAKGGKMLYADYASGGSHDLSLFEIVPQEEHLGLNIGATVALPYYVYGKPPKYPENAGQLFTLKADNSHFVTQNLSNQDITNILQRQGPILHFHPEESYFPSTAEAFINQSQLGKRNERWPISVDTLAEALSSVGNTSDVFFDFNDENLRHGDLVHAKSYIVANRVHHNFTDVQFWFFYPHNGKPSIRYEVYVKPLKHVYQRYPGTVNNGEHVGDWEHVILRVAHDTKQIAAVGYASHGDTVWYQAPKRDQHVDVYSALNMHGSYPLPKEIIELTAWIDQSNVKVALYSENKCGFGTAWDAYDNYEFLDARAEKPSWFGFKGFWGQTIEHYDRIEFKVEGINFYTFEYRDQDSGPSTPDFILP